MAYLVTRQIKFRKIFETNDSAFNTSNLSYSIPILDFSYYQHEFRTHIFDSWAQIPNYLYKNVSPFLSPGIKECKNVGIIGIEKVSPGFMLGITGSRNRNRVRNHKIDNSNCKV